MSNFKSISVRLEASVGPFAAQMAQAGAAVKGFGDDVTRVATQHKALAREVGLAGLAVGAGITAAFGLAVGAAVQFEASMRNVNSILTVSETQFEEMSRQVVELSTKMPQSAKELSAGLYDIASAGFTGSESMQVLKAAALGATAGVSTTAVAADALTTTMLAYGLSASKAADINDILFQGVNVGKVTFDDLAGALGTVVGIAAQIGSPIEDVTSALASMSLAGIRADEAATDLNGIFNALLKPSDAMATALAQMGFTSGQAAVQTLGLHGVMEKLREATGGVAAKTVELFGDRRAARGALALEIQDGQTYTRVQGQVADSSARAGAAQKAYAEQSKSVSVQMKLLRNDVTALGIQLGSALLPVLRPIVSFLQNLATGFSTLPGPVRVVAAGLLVLTAATAAFGGAALLIAPKIAEFKLAMFEMRAAGSALPGVLQATTVALGVTAVALAAGSIILAHYASQKAAAAAQTERLVEALRQEASGQVGASKAAVLKELSDAKALAILDRYHLSSVTATAAVLGQKKATDELATSIGAELFSASRAAKEHDRLVQALLGDSTARAMLNGEILAFSNVSDDEKNKIIHLITVVGNLTDHTGDAATIAGDLTAAEKALGIETSGTLIPTIDSLTDATSAATDATGQLAGALLQGFQSFSGPIDVYTAALQKKQDAEDAALRDSQDSQSQALRERQSAETTALRERQAAETRAADAAHAKDKAGVETWRDVLTQKQDAEDAALKKRQEAEDAALQKRQAAEKKSATLSVDELIAAEQEKVNAFLHWEQNLTTIAARGRPDLAKQLATMGDQGAQLSETLARANDEQFARASDAILADLELPKQVEDFQKVLADGAAIAKRGGAGIVNSLNAEFQTGKVTLAQLLAEYEKVLQGFGDIPPARLKEIPGTETFHGEGNLRFQAAGGIESGIATRETILFGERSTGSEAFVPRIGNHARALSTLAVAANWHGAKLTPMAAGGVTGPGAFVPRSMPSMPAAGSSVVRLHQADVDRIVDAVNRQRAPVNVYPSPEVDWKQIKRQIEWDRDW